MGIVASDEEADALFDAMDADGGGDLDLGELKSALKRMQACPTHRSSPESFSVSISAFAV